MTLQGEITLSQLTQVFTDLMNSTACIRNMETDKIYAGLVFSFENVSF